MSDQMSAERQVRVSIATALIAARGKDGDPAEIAQAVTVISAAVLPPEVNSRDGSDD